MFKLKFKPRADEKLTELENDPSQIIILNAVNKCLGMLEKNPKHNSLNSHEFYGISGNNGEKVLQSYAQNNTPRAYRILWHYGPDRKQITIVAIIPHT